MSQQRRRRRRRRRGGGRQPQQTDAGAPQESSATPEAGADRVPGRSKRRRRRRGGSRRDQAAPRTLEDVVRDVKGPPPERLTANPDGTTLDEVIGELQSIWGVPQYPQEYRITLKVAEDRSTASNGRAAEQAPNGITRERAPAAPRVATTASGSGDGPVREQAPRRRRARRGRRRGKPKGGSS